MPVIATADDARVNRRRGSAADGVTFWHTLYIGTTRYNMEPGTPDPEPGVLFPMAFLVEQDPGSVASAHYHQANQFQLIVHGNAIMGTHEVTPVTVHFAASHTAYGPIRASTDTGVHYFTLRNSFDLGARFMTMPENRAALRSVPRRRHREAVTGPLTRETGAIIGPEPDGMGAWRYRAVAGERLIGPDPAWGRGQYWVVVDGSMTRDDHEIPALSCVFVYPEDPPFDAFAGPGGVDVIAMQFPAGLTGIPMAKQIRLNAFDMNCVGHQSPGLWTHPSDRADSYNTLEYWTDLAKTLERGQFDAIFLADVLGIYDVYKGSAQTALENAVQVPVNDPLMVIPAMAVVTQNLGFGVTCALSYEHPYPFARRMSTLDHLTRGRIGWNIVTGYLESAARGMGRTEQTGHDERYAIAEDYMLAVYKLWEASWEDAAVLRDRTSGRFADPDKIHRITHEGPYFKFDAIHLSEPSLQRTPVLYQAGASTRGRQFAADHAECVFINGPSKKVIGGIVADIRRRAAASGRDPKDLVIYTMMTVITDQTREAALEKFRDYQRHVSSEGALALMSGWTGVDFSSLPKNEPVRFQSANAMISALEAFTTADPDRDWTVDEIARHAGIGGRGPVIVGSYQDVADEFESWVRETDVDGFNLAYAVTPGTFVDIVDLVVPELRRRGIYKTEYAAGTLREKLYGPGRARLPESHPAARVRRR